MNEEVLNFGLDKKDYDIYKSFLNSPYKSYKHASYFQVYSDILEPYRGKDITFVEVGVLNGGSLFMWRDYFGPKARIIGLDFNPDALRWNEEGFEIHIGNQADPGFWDDLYSRIGEVDIVLDDGGHTNEQQIVTLNKSIPNVRDGGLVIVEDTHTSYMNNFGNPSKYSFVNYAKFIVDSINSRFPNLKLPQNQFKDCVYNVSFYESIICFRIDRAKCFANFPVWNEGVTFNAEDFWDKDKTPGAIDRARDFVKAKASIVENNPALREPLKKAYRKIFKVKSGMEFRKLKKYFK